MAMTLAEKIAARRAAQNTTPEASAPLIVEEKQISPLDIPEETTPPVVQTATQPDKPLTFAEKLALKKQSIAAAQSRGIEKERTTAVIDPSILPDNPEDAQAYVDIKNKIEALTDLFADDLKNAMHDLQDALKKNAAACELMYDEDLGKMVMALRRMKGEDVVIATTAKKKGAKPKAKDVMLTKEELEAAFDF